MTKMWTLAAAALVLAGCTSSGGVDVTGPSLSAVESRLRTDPTIRTALRGLENNVKAQSLAYGCIAKAVVRDADTSDLVAFAAGRKDISDFANSTITTDIKGCARSAVTQATAG